MNLFDRITKWLDRSEVSWVTLLTKVLPILVPIIPAFQTKSHVVGVLGYDEWMGWISAAIVEFFGYASMYTMMKFAFKKAGFWMVAFSVAIYLMYLAIIMAFNVVPEVEANKEPHIIWMNALFSILSVPAGALTAVSALHTQKEEQEENERERLRAEQTAERERRRTERERIKAEQLANEQRTNTPERTRRTANNEHRTPQRTNVPQPANERRTENEQSEQHPFGFPKNEQMSKKEQLLAYIEQLEANGEAVPGPSELERRTGIRKGYISDVLNGKA